jgi:RHS repeat-associated protein
MKRYFFTVILFAFVFADKTYAQDIISSSAVVLPQVGQTAYTVASGQTVLIKSAVSVTLQAGVTLSAGSSVTIIADPNLVVSDPFVPDVVVPVAANPSTDVDRNWIAVRSYDDDGNEISAGKSFFDYNGKLLQSQTKNESSTHVMASQPLYDLEGRAVGETLSAPVLNSAFAYKANFVTNSGGAMYDYSSFDWNNTFNSGNPYAKTESPDAVGNTQSGSLGWYYSNNNTLESMVATTGYPYTRTDFYHDGSSSAKRSAGVGELLAMGALHEVSSNAFPVLSELDKYVEIRNKYFPGASVGATPISMAGQALQTLTIDQDGLKALSVTDLSGKTLMTGRADALGWLSVSNTAALNAVAGLFTFNISTDGPNSGGPNSGQYTGIRSFSLSPSQLNQTVTVMKSGTTIYTGAPEAYVHTMTVNGSSYEITSTFPFYVNASDSYGKVYDNSSSTMAEPTKSSVHYFQLAVPGAVNLTGNVSLYDMKTEQQLSSFISGSTLQTGYYKAVAISGDATVNYTNKYADISYKYYNQLGQLVAEIAPKGAQQLISNISAYPATSPVPYSTVYEYDLQGRLTASTSTDGGRSEYIYRQDGKIRFSQNASQRVQANAGTGNFEKYSYTNYDQIGRPVESGEYLVPNGSALTFASAKTNSALQESVAADGGLTGGARLSQVNTYYDIPANNLSLSGYVQDAAFLNGGISYTTSAGSTTWYNYDDRGRVVWTVKQLTGMSGYKTIDYTYNGQGNVSQVDYQKGVGGERFVHHYIYDADGRLINVQTSRDGANKAQQARYYYYLHGPLKRMQLGKELQGLDYVYTPQGWLKAINSATGDPAKDPNHDGASGSTFATDAFAMQLEYFPNDYIRSASNITSIPTGQSYYSGNVNGLSWQSKKPQSVVSTAGSQIQNPTMYSYGYDNKYQLTAATWGTPSFTGTVGFTAGNIFQEKNISYDANGNIAALQRTNSSGAVSDDFSNYAYQSGTNKLTSVGNTAGSTVYASYIYDELGQLKSQVQGANTSYIKYDVSGKITGVYSDAAMTPANARITYTYDEAGNRIKSVSALGTTWYVYDASGNVIAIYTGSTGTTLAEVPVYGSDRVGTYYLAGNNYVYELKDNVGSVRVVLNREKVSGQADIIAYNDYYPYGSMARNANANGYRYEYQGAYAEKDQVTGWNNFELRMYDSRIGRWLSVDPMGQLPFAL